MFAVMAISVISLTGCGNGEDGTSNVIKLTSSDQILSYDDEFQIVATSDTPITYTSENEYHAEVSESGLVTAGRVGETNIVLTNGEDTKKVKITVQPQSNLYPEPDLTFGMSRSAVKAKLGTPDSETDGAIGYGEWSYAADIVMCLFDGADKLTSYAVMVKTAYTEQLSDFLSERYVLGGVDADEYLLAYVNGLDPNSTTMLIGAQVYNLSYWMVIYLPYSATSRSGYTANHSDIMKSIEELMNK